MQKRKAWLFSSFYSFNFQLCSSGFTAGRFCAHTAQFLVNVVVRLGVIAQQFDLVNDTGKGSLLRVVPSRTTAKTGWYRNLFLQTDIHQVVDAGGHFLLMCQDGLE